MKMTTDLDLLREYATQRSENAFAILVTRHLDLVYSAALRQVKSSQLAEEITQSVFTDLAQNVRQLKPDTVLAAWLYQVTRRTAMNVLRGEMRRQAREQIAVELADMNATSSDWPQIEPCLDEAMETLDEPDRAAILLRYFENKSLRDVGATMGTSEDAAQKRVSRAVERLREFFSKRNVKIGASGLAVVISANAVQAAPIGLAVAISSAVSLVGTAVQTSTALAATTKTIAMTTLQKTLIAAALVAATGAGIYEAREASILRDEVQTLRREQTPLNDGFKQLHSKFQEATNQLALALEDNEQLNRSISELPKLRDEVARLRKDSRDLAQIKADNQSDPTQVAMKSWLARVTQLKQRFEERPEHNIPELQLVGERDWLDAAHGKLETEEDYRRAMSRLRSIAENKVANLLHPALRKYLAANEGNFPTDLSQLQPYFKSPVDAVVLQRYDIFPASEVPNVGVGNWIITQKAPIDIDYDSRWVVGANGTGSSGSAWKEDKTLPPAIAALKSAMNEYKQAHDGKEPLDPLQLKPFLKTPEQEKALEKILQSLAAMKAKENED